MNDLSTTREAGDPVAGCECSCDKGWADVQDEVNQALRSPDPLERNRQITAAYDRLAQADRRNIWVRLASYVSVQGGCAMQRTQAWDAQSIGRIVVNPEDALDALQDANRTIFSSIYPVVRFAQKCGAEQLRNCVESGAFEANPALLDAMDKVEQGQLREASDIIAQYEQVDVVQKVYERHAGTFDDLMTAEIDHAGRSDQHPDRQALHTRQSGGYRRAGYPKAAGSRALLPPPYRPNAAAGRRRLWRLQWRLWRRIIRRRRRQWNMVGRALRLAAASLCLAMAPASSAMPQEKKMSDSKARIVLGPVAAAGGRTAG